MYKIMKRTATLGLLLALFSAAGLRAEVYTIDFNRGTVSGTNIEKDIEAAGVTPNDYCSAGAEYFTLNPITQNCRFDSNGCGIRIATAGGQGLFVISLEAKKNVSKVVAYASKISGNTKAELTFFAADTPVQTFANDELTAYSASNPASTAYKLPDIIVNKEFRDLKFKTPKNGNLMLHRIDIYIEDGADAIHSPVASVDEMGDFCNLAGQRVSKPSHGIYIKGGKKYFVK